MCVCGSVLLKMWENCLHSYVVGTYRDKTHVPIE